MCKKNWQSDGAKWPTARSVLVETVAEDEEEEEADKRIKNSTYNSSGVNSEVE